MSFDTPSDNLNMLLYCLYGRLSIDCWAGWEGVTDIVP